MNPPDNAIVPEPFSLVVGPCSVESYETFSAVARMAKRWGATALRGGIFKMRARPETFQGLGPEALDIVKACKLETGLPFITEITDPRQIDLLAPVADVLQVGARNMHNTELLRELGRTRIPVLLKRGLSAYLDELLHAAEYITREGNSQVTLCERGTRGFERATRNTLDLAAVPYLKARSGLKVWVDPSHGTGVRALVPPMCWAAAAAGADGLLIEVHPEPDQSISDAEQALGFPETEAMLERLHRVLAAMDRRLATVSNTKGLTP